MMLSKKIRRLKKMVKQLEQNYINKLIDKKLSDLNKKIKSQDETIISLEKKIDSIQNSVKKEDAEFKNGINSLLKTVSDLEDYKDLCSKDMSTLASAITELYNILNYMLGGKLLVKKEDSVEDEVYFEEVLDFDEYIDENGIKKKKKVYH